MEAIEVLRKQALTRRDNAIQQARNEYARTLQRIDELHAELFTSPREVQSLSLGDLLLRLIPKRDLFTINQVLTTLRNDYPDRRVSEKTVRTMFCQFRRKGLVRRVKKRGATVFWGAPDCKATQDGTLELPTIADATEAAIREHGPLRLVEILVYLKEHGHPCDDDPKVAMRPIYQVLRRNKGRFGLDNEGRVVLV